MPRIYFQADIHAFVWKLPMDRQSPSTPGFMHVFKYVAWYLIFNINYNSP